MHIEQTQNATRIINNDGLTAFLTEMVFRLSAIALNPIAVNKMFAFKEWPSLDSLMFLKVPNYDI